LHEFLKLLDAPRSDDGSVAPDLTALLTAATLVMRPVGATRCGIRADRMGRWIPLLADVCRAGEAPSRSGT